MSFPSHIIARQVRWWSFHNYLKTALSVHELIPTYTCISACIIVTCVMMTYHLYSEGVIHQCYKCSISSTCILSFCLIPLCMCYFNLFATLSRLPPLYHYQLLISANWLRYIMQITFYLHANTYRDLLHKAHTQCQQFYIQHNTVTEWQVHNGCTN